MAENRVQRRLAAILAADMVGYSRLMGEDETGTITRQKAHRSELIDPKIAEHNGRIVKTTGDGLLVEFGSAVDAVLCAVEIQRAIAEREAQVPDKRRIAYRVGINLGEIVIDGEDILGDGVNVAARLEALAQPGGIRISEVVFKNVTGKLDLGFADLGPQKVKNITEPVAVYEILLDPDAAGQIVRTRPPTARWRWAAAAGLVLIAAVGGLVLWQPWSSAIEPARMAKMAFPLPKRPSIAVLPFSNLSGDKSQEFLADGLTENIISALSNASQMFVISRNSTFVYKGKAVPVRRVAEALGVRFVLEGSFQKSGQRIRVTARLIDAVSGKNLWSERYDRKLSDLFSVQDDITRRIVVSLHVELTEGEQIRIRSKLTTDITSWEQSQKALRHYRRYNKRDNQVAKELATASVERDPKNILGWTVLAWAHWADARFQFTASKEASLDLAIRAAKKALALDAQDTDALTLLGGVRLMRRDYDGAVKVVRKAVELKPNFADGLANLGFFLTYSGKPQEAIGLMKRAMRLAPYHPSWYPLVLGRAYRLTGQFEEAISAIKTAVSRTPNALLFQLELTATLSEAGRLEEARMVAARVLALNPKFTVSNWAKTVAYRDQATQQRFLDGLRRAGLPD